jgi:chromosome segregation protein
MKRLEKIRLVQFFLFEREEILLEEISGVFGPNASGKSSLLDAVQIAMLGANSRHVALNAQADEGQRTTRSLRAYCLGQYGETPEDRVRDHATTYISLIWRDLKTGAPLTMGVCITASADRDTHNVEGRYLLPGVELQMGDHLEVVDGQERPREWSSFRHQLKEKERITGEDSLYPDSTRYIKAMLLGLRGSGSMPEAEAFVRAFRFALHMRFDRTVDSIVRNDVLEARPTNIRKFKEVTDTFRQLAQMITNLQQKIADGKKVEAEFIKASQEAGRVATWDVMSKMAEVGIATEAHGNAIEVRVQVEDELASTRSTLQQNVHQISEASKQVERFRSLKEGHRSHKDYRVLQSDIQSAEQRAAQKEKGLRDSLKLIHRALAAAAKSGELLDEAELLTKASETVKTLQERQQLLSASEIDDSIRPALKAAEQAFLKLQKQQNQLSQDSAEVGKKHKDAVAALERVKSGRPPLATHVQRLLTELQDHGLHPTPVCDLVMITDQEWQPVIESYLKSNLQALLVEPAEELEAFRIYRGMTGQRAVYGAKIARTSRHIERPLEPGSVAELIEGDNPAAIAFLRRQLGDLKRATTNNEALSGSRTLTADGMLVSGGDFERLQPVHNSNFMIGAGSPNHIAAVQKEVLSLAANMAALIEASKTIQTLLDTLRLIANEEWVINSITELLRDIGEAHSVADLKTSLLEGMADEEYVQLGRQEQDWLKEVDKLKEAKEGLNHKIWTSEARYTQLLEAEQQASDHVAAMATALEQARQHPEYDHDFWLSHWDRVMETYDGKMREMVTYCEQQRERAKERKNNAIYSGMREFGVFLTTYHEQTLTDTSEWERAHKWLSELLERLERTELATYRDEMDAAYRTSQETFRNDVAIALNGHIEWLGDTIDRLNEVLRRCPTFSNGERYRFRRVVKPHLGSLLKFIKDVAAFGPTQDLLGGAGDMPQEFKELLNEKIAPGAAGVKSPLDDYREFYDFDIEILREDPLSKESKVVGHLSKRLGPGSGGEHRSPLYVIAGAALASAYRLDHGNHDGLRLMLLDEAFNKMDITNIVATMRYLEQLGLQVFMASPGENLGILTAFLHRYYEILRDSDNNTVMFSGHNVSEKTRAQFREDLPEFNPSLIDQELEIMREHSKVLSPSTALTD